VEHEGRYPTISKSPGGRDVRPVVLRDIFPAVRGRVYFVTGTVHRRLAVSVAAESSSRERYGLAVLPSAPVGLQFHITHSCSGIRAGAASSPKEVTTLNSYELMMILRPDVEDAGRGAILERVTQIIDNEGGTVFKVDEWGKRRFAYEIDHMNEGFYYVLTAKCSPETMDELTRILGIADSVVRSMPVRLREEPQESIPYTPQSAESAAVAAEADAGETTEE